MSKQILCKDCGVMVESDEYVGETNQCIECHDGEDLPLDECGCERCIDKAVRRADFHNDPYAD